MTIKFATSIHQIPAGQNYFRVQRHRAIPGTLQRNGFLLRPPAGLIFRFDLDGIPTAYLGDSKLTAIYESLLRRC